MNTLQRFVGYFLFLTKLLGFVSAVVFTAQYVAYRWIIPNRKLYRMPLSRLSFYCTSIEQFNGLFMEIFVDEFYYLPRTNAPIVAIDAGANIGVALLYIKMRCPNARVTCYEPNPSACAVLARTIEANHWGNEVTLRRSALGKSKGTVDFFIDNGIETSSGGSLTNFVGSNGHSYPVEVVPLSESITEPIDFLKIDIEGGEFDVLEDLVAHDKLKLISAVQLEHHYHPTFFPRPLSEMLRLLESAGFRTSARATLRPSAFIGRDGVVAHMVFAWRDAK